MSLVHPKEHDIVLFIGSGSVSGAVVQFQKMALPKIVYTHESQFPLKDQITADSLSEHMLAALHTVLDTLHNKHRSKIKSVAVAFASPWFSSSSRNLKIDKKSPFVVSEKIIEKLVTEQTVVSRGEKKETDIPVEKTPSHIKLNGYETSEPYGKLAESLEVSIYTSTVPHIVREKIESEIYTVVHPSSVVFHTIPFVAWNVIVSLFAPKEDFVFIDIGSEVTDILVVRHGSISSVVSLPLGKNHLVRNVAINFETHPELASTLVSLYSHDAADVGVKEKVKTLVEAFGEEWGMRFQAALGESENNLDHFLPQKSFFVSDQNFSKVFNDIIKKQIPNTVSLAHDNLSQFVEFAGNENLNIFLALTSICLAHQVSHNKIIYKREPNLVK